MIRSNVSCSSRIGSKLSLVVWDMRSLRKPLATADFLPNAYPQTNVIFAPDDRTILTGLSVTKGSGKKGEIVVLNRDDLTEKRRIPISEGSVIKVAWHSRINQVCPTTPLRAALTVCRSSPRRPSAHATSSTRQQRRSTAPYSHCPRCHVKTRHATTSTPTQTCHRSS
jgi:hypothetical protein